MKNKLHSILNKAGLSDDEIRGGVELSSSGYAKLTKRFGLDANEIKSRIEELVYSLQQDHRAGFVSESVENDGSYEDEIKSSKVGTYNFPWKLKDNFGTATASYSDDSIKVVDVRDSNGEEVPELIENSDILKQAISFIGRV